MVGPNTAGLVTTGECFVGFMPAFMPASLTRPCRRGLAHRSLGTLVCLNLTRAGLGISSFIGIGGDPMIGTTTRDALETLDRTVVPLPSFRRRNRRRDGGGAAADYAKRMSKPMVAFIAGAAAPAGKKMGHAGAIVTGNAGSYASKRQALEAAGVVVVDTPAQIAAAVAAGLQTGRAGSKFAVS